MRRLLPASCAALLAGCAPWRLWGEVPVPAGPSSPASAAAVPAAPPSRRAAALFYSDLGPDALDVSAYPRAQRKNYEVYARACSRCHTLARSLNAPFVGRAWWEFYSSKMRARAGRDGVALSSAEVNAVVDFLEFDANERKVARAPEFEALKGELKSRFERLLNERAAPPPDRGGPR